MGTSENAFDYARQIGRFVSSWEPSEAIAAMEIFVATSIGMLAKDEQAVETLLQRQAAFQRELAHKVFSDREDARAAAEKQEAVSTDRGTDL